jgi:hypothetical protein
MGVKLGLNLSEEGGSWMCDNSDEKMDIRGSNRRLEEMHDEVLRDCYSSNYLGGWDGLGM